MEDLMCGTSGEVGMKLVYFDFGEARIQYGSAASMKLQGNDVYVVEFSNNPFSPRKDTRDVEVGINGNTEKVKVDIIRVHAKSPTNSLIAPFYNYAPLLMDIIPEINPDVLISGSNYWITANNIKRTSQSSLIFWKTVVPGLFKLPIFVKYGKGYTRIVSTPLGFVYDVLLAFLSDYTLTNDRMTMSIFKKLRIKNVKIIWPTYTKFLKKSAYSEFMRDNKRSNITSCEISTKYILSLITLEKGSPAYRIELKALNFLKNIATKMSDIDVIVIGASMEDIENPTGYKNLKNLKLIGKIYGDLQMSELYRNAYCVLCPIYIPGFSNRLFEAFFYGKAIISTSIVSSYYEGLEPGVNIIFADNTITAIKAIKDIVLKDHYRWRLEENARRYYLSYFSPQRHAEDLEQMLSCIIGGGIAVD